MESKPLYIIGMGINSAIGTDASETCQALRNSRSGISRTTLLESAHKDLPVGEVPLTNEALRQRLHIPADEAITRSALLGIMAVREALRSAGVSPKEVPMAFVNGTTVGGMDCSEQYYLDFLNNDSRNEFIALHDVGACTRQIADISDHLSTRPQRPPRVLRRPTPSSMPRGCWNAERRSWRWREARNA